MGAILDIGIKRPTVGNRVFAVMKGACDAGVYVPHNVKKFPGFEKLEDKKTTYNAEVHRDRIFGCHIDEKMERSSQEERTRLHRSHVRETPRRNPCQPC